MARNFKNARTYLMNFDEMKLKAQWILGLYTIIMDEPYNDSYSTETIPFSVEEILDGTAIYCVQQVEPENTGISAIIGDNAEFLVTGLTRKGKQYLINKWLQGERTQDEQYF